MRAFHGYSSTSAVRRFWSIFRSLLATSNRTRTRIRLRRRRIRAEQVPRSVNSTHTGSRVGLGQRDNLQRPERDHFTEISPKHTITERKNNWCCKSSRVYFVPNDRTKSTASKLPTYRLHVLTVSPIAHLMKLSFLVIEVMSSHSCFELRWTSGHSWTQRYSLSPEWALQKRYLERLLWGKCSNISQHLPTFELRNVSADI